MKKNVEKYMKALESGQETDFPLMESNFYINTRKA